jgi:L-serine dehydratase
MREKNKVDTVIKTSIFDLFKIGPGPSSSHTIGPMKAAFHFRKQIEQLSDAVLAGVDGVRVTLYGSLSSTGKGHGTDRSAVGGLLGMEPATCDPKLLSNLLKNKDDLYTLNLRGYNISIYPVVFGDQVHNFPYQNTMIIQLLSKEKPVLEKEYYSIGGGFIECKGESKPERPEPVYSYSNMTELRLLLNRKNIDLSELMIQNEMVITGESKRNIINGLDNILKAMCDAVERGLNTTGILPGPIGLNRNAGLLLNRSHHLRHVPSRFIMLLNAYALAASEENAQGNIVVTAPTSGASGVLPGIVYAAKKHHKTNQHLLRDGLLAAAVIGFIIKHNASISGAEAGCQAEVGAATAMGAAFLAHANGYSIEVIESSAEIGLEHQLGMTCDPVLGYVQIPCIERNAVGAITAYNAFLLGMTGNTHSQKVTFDKVVEALKETGKDMCSKYKETAKGGLAITCC